jgi:hypothetical protein
MALDRTPSCVDSPESVRSAVQFSVTRLTQADKVFRAVRFRRRRMVRVETAVMDVQSRTAKLPARGTTAVLIGDYDETQDAPTRAAIGGVSPAPGRRLWTCVRALVRHMTRARAEFRRVAEVLRAAFNLEWFQTERLLTLRARKHDWFNPCWAAFPTPACSVGFATTRRPDRGRAISQRQTVAAFGSTAPRAVLFPSHQGLLDHHRRPALLARFLNALRRIPFPAERWVLADHLTAFPAARDPFGILSSCDLTRRQIDRRAARCTRETFHTVSLPSTGTVISNNRRNESGRLTWH